MNKIRIKKLKVTSEMECSKLMSGWGIRSYASSKTTSTLCTCERGLCIRIKRLLNSGRITPADVSNTTKKGRKDGNLENLWRWKTRRARKEKPEKRTRVIDLRTSRCRSLLHRSGSRTTKYSTKVPREPTGKGVQSVSSFQALGDGNGCKNVQNDSDVGAFFSFHLSLLTWGFSVCFFLALLIQKSFCRIQYRWWYGGYTYMHVYEIFFYNFRWNHLSTCFSQILIYFFYKKIY